GPPRTSDFGPRNLGLQTASFRIVRLEVGYGAAFTSEAVGDGKDFKAGSEIREKEMIDLIGGGGWTRTNDLRIMSPNREGASEEDKELNSANSSKVLQNRQP